MKVLYVIGLLICAIPGLAILLVGLWLIGHAIAYALGHDVPVDPETRHIERPVKGVVQI